MKRAYYFFIVVFLAFFLAGCGLNKKHGPAPVINGWNKDSAKRHAYIVQKGDTLYSIAWAFDMDFRDLAKINGLSASPEHIRAGQKIYLSAAKKPSKTAATHATQPSTIFGKQGNSVTAHTSSGSAAQNNIDESEANAARAMNKKEARETASAPAAATSSTPSSAVTDAVLTQRISCMVWPTKGKILRSFDNKLGGSKGIDIGGKWGSPVVAGAAGKVVYCGNGIRSYGNLIIIKHNDSYLSAYAYNKTVTVREGQMVAAGQKIATLGHADSGIVMLHFEIRRNGKPVNPLLFLTKK